MTALPEVKHIYQNHHLDSTRWEHYTPRDDDIIIATPYKSGTTWMQNIVLNLIFQDLEMRPIGTYSPWVEVRWDTIDDIMNLLNSQQQRRVIKSHLPLDGLLFHAQVKYIVVGRDARDVFMSMWNHYRNYSFLTYANVNVNTIAGQVGGSLPLCPDDIREFWHGWTTKGWFEWESEGYPFWSNFRHVQTWWNFRHLDNILFVHFNDLLQDLEGEIRRIADYLEIGLSEALLPKIADAVTFKTMKENAEKIIPSITLKGGAKGFINKGTNGRWRGVLTEADLKLYDAAVARELSPDCATWLEGKQ